MNLLMIGSANQYAKHEALKTQWNLKKQSGDFHGHKKSLSDYVNTTKASSVLPQADADEKKMSAIMTKAEAGRKLSHDEWEYLRAKNPVMYEKLKAIEREQKAYEKELKHCKTRDEARRLHLSKLGEVLSAAKKGDESALIRLNRLTRTMTDFAKSEAYHRMPTEADEAIEREQEREARQEALRMEAEIKEAAAAAKQDADTDTDTENELVSDAEPEPVPDTKSEPVAVPDTKSELVTVSDTKSKAVTVPDTKSEPATEIDVPRPVSVLAFGERAYVGRRDEASGDARKRKIFETEA